MSAYLIYFAACILRDPLWMRRVLKNISPSRRWMSQEHTLLPRLSARVTRHGKLLTTHRYFFIYKRSRTHGKGWELIRSPRWRESAGSLFYLSRMAYHIELHPRSKVHDPLRAASLRSSRIINLPKPSEVETPVTEPKTGRSRSHGVVQMSSASGGSFPQSCSFLRS